MAALNVRISGTESQLNHARKEGIQLDSDIKEARVGIYNTDVVYIYLFADECGDTKTDLC